MKAVKAIMAKLSYHSTENRSCSFCYKVVDWCSLHLNDGVLHNSLKSRRFMLIYFSFFIHSHRVLKSAVHISWLGNAKGGRGSVNSCDSAVAVGSRLSLVLMSRYGASVDFIFPSFVGN